MNIPSPTPPPDNRLDYWRHVARTAEADLHRMHDGILDLIYAANSQRRHPDGDSAILDDMLTELRRLANQTTDPHQRAQNAYNAVSGRFPELDK